MKHYNNAKKPSVYSQNNLFFVDALGIINDNHFLIDREIFHNNLILYVQEGAFHIEQKGHHILRAGEFLLMRLTEKHKYYTAPTNDSTTIFWIHFGDNHMSHLTNFIETNHGMPYIGTDSLVRDCFLTCIQAAKDNDPRREFIYSEKIYQILLSINYKIGSIE